MTCSYSSSVLLAVAQTRHFTQAAELLGVGQPTLSKQIHTLERSLGAPLFDAVRGRRGAHRRRRDAAAAGPARWSRTPTRPATRCRTIVGLRRGEVRLGATPSLCASLVPGVLRTFRPLTPRSAARDEGSSADLIADLLATAWTWP
jgi:DNA-binding transcriptional LysR family regulator